MWDAEGKKHAFCSRNGKASGNDNGSRDLFMTLLKDEERSRRLLEAQVHPIKELSYDRYFDAADG
jgi:bacterioferritin (cytochrome b1)